MKKSNKMKILLIGGMAFFLLLLFSIGLNVYQAVCKFDSYLQDTEEIYIMESGILRNNLAFHYGTTFELHYDFSHESYAQLRNAYGLEHIAKDGTEFEKSKRLMHEYASRLTHESYYDNHIPLNALDLLEYSLDNKKQGINCRAKAQILNEMCLSLGIYSRKVWIMPYSGYDTDCHVVNEIWDSSLNKWIMLDITNDEYWVDEHNTPLSILEIRYKAAMHEFCTPVAIGDKTNHLSKLKEKHMGDFLYIIKNMVYMAYCTNYTIGESEDTYLLLPTNIPTESKFLISEDKITCAPM